MYTRQTGVLISALFLGMVALPASLHAHDSGHAFHVHPEEFRLADPLDDLGDVQEAFRIGQRWEQTTADTSTGNNGDPINLTWSIVPDGTIAPGINDDPAAPSDLIAFMDSTRNLTGGGSDLQSRPWFNLFSDSFGRWDELSGVNYTYLANDDGARISSRNAPGVANVRGDIRIGGRGMTGSGLLGFNNLPDGGDMVLNTNQIFNFASPSGDHLRARNTITHEAGHGLGLRHVTSSSSALMQPFLDTFIDGPQIDDILGIQRSYGDALEENGGNDTIGTATFAQTFVTDDTWSIGTDAGDSTFVQRTQTDYVSIDDDTDLDVYAFALIADGILDASLAPKGPTYGLGNNNTDFVSSELSDLTLEILDATGNRVAFSDAGELGFTENIFDLNLVAGDYFARIAGLSDNVQLYRLDLSVTVPEPAALAVLVTLGLGLFPRRRRAD